MTDTRHPFDSVRDANGGIGRAGLEEILPYGDEFLFVDRVSRLTSEEVEAGFRIPDQSSYLDSHFVGLPIMPGVLVGEGLAQAGSLIVRYNLPRPHDHHVLGLAIEQARFHAPARPGETLSYQVRLAASSRRSARLEGEVTVGARRICQARIVVAIVEKGAFSHRLADLE